MLRQVVMLQADQAAQADAREAAVQAYAREVSRAQTARSRDYARRMGGPRLRTPPGHRLITGRCSTWPPVGPTSHDATDHRHQPARRRRARAGDGVRTAPDAADALPPSPLGCARSRWTTGRLPRFDGDGFRTLLEREREHRDLCRFVTVPDVIAAGRAGQAVGDASLTREVFDARSELFPYLAGWPLAYVVQDGQEAVPIPWRSVRAVFVGGSDGYKDGAHAAAVVKAAKLRGPLGPRRPGQRPRPVPALRRPRRRLVRRLRRSAHDPPARGDPRPPLPVAPVRRRRSRARHLTPFQPTCIPDALP